MNIIQGGVLLSVYLFVVIAAFVFLSGPFDDFVTSFENINLSASDSYVEANSTLGRTVFDIVFVLLALVGIFWFIFWVFRYEPDWGFRQGGDF